MSSLPWFVRNRDNKWIAPRCFLCLVAPTETNTRLHSTCPADSWLRSCVWLRRIGAILRAFESIKAIGEEATGLRARSRHYAEIAVLQPDTWCLGEGGERKWVTRTPLVDSSLAVCAHCLEPANMAGESRFSRVNCVFFFFFFFKKKHLVVEEDMALVTSVQPMNNRTTNTAGCWGTLQLLYRVGKLTMVAHKSISIWVGIWEFQSDPPALRLLHQRRVDTTCVFCGSCPSPALSADPSRLCLNATGMSFTFSG